MAALCLSQITLFCPKHIVLDENVSQIIRRIRISWQIPQYDLETLKQLYLKGFNLQNEMNEAALAVNVFILTEDQRQDLIKWAEKNLEKTIIGRMLMRHYGSWKSYFDWQASLGRRHKVRFIDALTSSTDITYSNGRFSLTPYRMDLENRVLEIGQEKQFLAHGVKPGFCNSLFLRC